VTNREKCLRLADKFKSDAFMLAECDTAEATLTALENCMQLLAVALVRDEATCKEVYDTILACVPQLIPS
jgi:hypothetical protein